MDRSQLVQRERVIAYMKVRELVELALLQERRALDLTRAAVTLRAQIVAANIIDTLWEDK